jgi:hypothetical protein
MHEKLKFAAVVSSRRLSFLVNFFSTTFPMRSPRSPAEGRCATATVLRPLASVLLWATLLVNMGRSHAQGVWTVSSGNQACELSRDGMCVSDGNDESCTVRAEAAVVVSAQGGFETEAGYDYVTIGGTQYPGTSGPVSVPISAGETLHWQSDYSEVRSGFNICIVIALPASPPPPPTAPLSPPPAAPPPPAPPSPPAPPQPPLSPPLPPAVPDIGHALGVQAYIKAPNTEASDLFGNAVSLSGDTLAVGVPYEDSCSTSVATTASADNGC